VSGRKLELDDDVDRRFRIARSFAIPFRNVHHRAGVEFRPKDAVVLAGMR
jgi:hypothetical protein